jgi:hypothetical protein
MMLHMRQRVIDNAEGAVSTMESFLRTAKQRIAEVKDNPDSKDFTGQPRFLNLPESMLHELAWGFANASGHIGSAIDATHDFLTLLETGPSPVPLEPLARK